MDQTSQLLSGGPLYAEPDLNHIPYLYTPLYYYVSAAVSMWTGLELWVLRAINLVCMVGTAALLGRLVWKETRCAMPSVLAGGVLLAGYQMSDTWYDVARNDGLYMLLVGTLILVLRSKRRGTEYFAAALVVLAFLAKQSIGLLLPFVCLAAIAWGWWRAVRFGAAAALGLAITWGSYALASDGWFHYFVFAMPRAHNPQEDGYLINFLTKDIAQLVWTVPVLVLWLLACIRGKQGKRLLFFTMLTLGMVFSAWQSRLHAGGYKNAVIPALWASGLVLGLGTAQFRAGMRNRRDGTPMPLPQLVTGCLLLLLASIQLFGMHGAVRLEKKVPTDAERAAQAEWKAHLQAVEGPVYMPFTGGLGEATGNVRAGHAMAMADILRHQENTLTLTTPDWRQWPIWAPMVQRMADTLKEERFAAVVVDSPYHHLWFKYFDMPALGYRKAPIPIKQPRLLKPVVGLESFPQSYWVPKN